MGIGYGYIIHYDLAIGRSIVSIIPKFRHNGNQCLNRLLLLGCSNSFMRSDGIYLGRNIYRSHTHTRHAMVNGNSNALILYHLFCNNPNMGKPCIMACVYLLSYYSWCGIEYNLSTSSSTIQPLIPKSDFAIIDRIYYH